MGEDLLTGLGQPHIPGHLHRLVHDIGLAGVHVRGGENAFGGGVAHLHRGHDVEGLGPQLQIVEGRAGSDAGCGFGPEEPTEIHGQGKRSKRE